MPAATLSKLDKIVLPSSVEFSQVSRGSWTAGVESLLDSPAGHPFPMFRANRMQAPALSFTTPQLATLLAAVGLSGASMSTIDSYFKTAAVTGSVARATTSHKRVRITSSCVYWSQIRLPHNGKAEADVVIAANWDGSNDPFIYAGMVALPGNLTAAEVFGLGPVKLNGSALAGVQNVTIDSGVQLLRSGASSELWDSFVGLQQAAPTVTIQVLGELNWSTILLEGTKLNGSAGVQVYARKYDANGSRIANGTGAHVLFTGLLGSAIPVESSGEGSGATTDTIRCELVASSDSVAPLTIAVSQTIS